MVGCPVCVLTRDKKAGGGKTRIRPPTFCGKKGGENLGGRLTAAGLVYLSRCAGSEQAQRGHQDPGQRQGLCRHKMPQTIAFLGIGGTPGHSQSHQCRGGHSR